MQTIWLVAAAEFEIENFSEFVLKIKNPHWQLIPFLCGVGTHQSLFNITSKLRQTKTPNAILQVGTGGIFSPPQTLPLKSLFLAREFILPPHKTEQYPQLMAHSFSFPVLPFDGLKNLPQFKTFSSFGISVCEKNFAGAKKDFFSQAENMEAYSLAFAARQLQIPFNSLLCVSNYIGKNARKEFQENYAYCGNRLKEKIGEIFLTG